MSNDVLTASRMSTHLRCQRQSYWKDEVGLRSDHVPLALAFGSAWARAMEARWHGAGYEAALGAALPDDLRLEPMAASTVSALLAGYYRHWGGREEFAKIHPEQKFSLDLGDGWTAQGKMDGLGTRHDLVPIIVEGKTTRSRIDPDSDYWMRLRFNVQVLQYAEAASHYGWNVREVVYDVVRKPMIKAKNIPNRDADGRKIVLDSGGNRVWKQAPKKGGKPPEPRQSADEDRGWVLSSHEETPEEFYDRLLNDCFVRPEFYFARREIPILDGEVEDFQTQRWLIQKQIELNRSLSSLPRPEWAWTRSVSHSNCNWCPYSGFCLLNVGIDPEQPPSGFSVQPFNPELKDETDDSSEADTE